MPGTAVTKYCMDRFTEWKIDVSELVKEELVKEDYNRSRSRSRSLSVGWSRSRSRSRTPVSYTHLTLPTILLV